MGKQMNSKSVDEATGPQISMRVTPKLKEDFDNQRHELGLSQSKFIALLLDCYKKSRHIREDASPYHVSRYRISSYQSNTPVESFSFYGTIKHVSDWTERIVEESLAEYLRSQKLCEWKYSFQLGRIPQLRLRHMLTVYYCYSEQRHIIEERTEIYQEGYYRDSASNEKHHEYSLVLDQCDCKFITDFKDVKTYFGKFSTNEELNAVRRVVSVEKDLSMMNDPF